MNCFRFRFRVFCIFTGTSLFMLGLVILCLVYFLSVVVWLFLVVSTSAIDCLERLISEMTYYVSSGTLNTHSLMCLCAFLFQSRLVRYYFLWRWRTSLCPPLDNIWVMVIVWRLRGNIIKTALCWIVWHNVHSQQHTYMSSSYRFNRLGLSHWDPYAVRRGSCLELYYCITWWSGSGGIQAWSRRPTGFLQCFDTVGLVIWPVKIVTETTYHVLSETLNFYTTY